jgi:hypothetical protein
VIFKEGKFGIKSTDFRFGTKAIHADRVHLSPASFALFCVAQFCAGESAARIQAAALLILSVTPCVLVMLIQFQSRQQPPGAHRKQKCDNAVGVLASYSRLMAKLQAVWSPSNDWKSIEARICNCASHGMKQYSRTRFIFPQSAIRHRPRVADCSDGHLRRWQNV